MRQTNRADKSPRREAINSELDEHSNRIKQLLRADLTMLEQENAILKMRCMKISELQEKVEAVLNQNAHLMADNDRLSRIIHQQKSEYEILKNKYEGLASQRYDSVNSFEYEKKQLISELEHLATELHEMENLKNAQINELKSQAQIDLQNLKRQQSASEEIYQKQIRKLKDQIDRKEHEIGDYTKNLKKNITDREYQIVKLKEEKEKLKNELIYNESDRKKDLEALKQKMDANYLQEIETLKRNHLNHLQQMQREIMRYKQALQDRNNEIEDLSSKLLKQRNHYEDLLAISKRENESLKIKLIELQKITDHQMNEMQIKLDQIHQAELQQINAKHQRILQSYEADLYKLQNSNDHKSAQIQQLIKDKAEKRSIFDAEINRLKEENTSLNQKYKDLQSKHNDYTAKTSTKLAQKQKHLQYLDNINKEQKSNFEKEREEADEAIERLKRQKIGQTTKAKLKQQEFAENIRNLKEEEARLKEELKNEQEKTKKIEDSLKNDLNSTSTKIDTLIGQNRLVQKENQHLKNTILNKEKQIKLLSEKIKALENRQIQLQKQIDDLRAIIIIKEQKANSAMIEQKKKLQNAFQISLENHVHDSDLALKIQSNKVRDLVQKLKRKDNELQELLRMYKKMSEEITVLTEQQANKKDITLKFAGATADLIATKNMFDVFLKTKTLQVCGDALHQGKQNSK